MSKLLKVSELVSDLQTIAGDSSIIAIIKPCNESELKKQRNVYRGRLLPQFALKLTKEKKVEFTTEDAHNLIRDYLIPSWIEYDPARDELIRKYASTSDFDHLEFRRFNTSVERLYFELFNEAMKDMRDEDESEREALKLVPRK